MNISERLKQARALDRKEYERKEVEKRGNLRIGNSGIMNAEGEIAGGCHRVAHVRALGLELDPPDASRLIMFEGGFANEERVLLDLNKTKNDGEIILKEEEIPIEYKTSNGTKVSGRPDIVICSNHVIIPEGTKLKLWNTPGEIVEYTGPQPELSMPIPLVGIELKTVNSVWVSRDALFTGKPKLENVIQAVHYMWKLKCPEYKLIYRSYSQQVVPAFGLFLPAPGEPFSEHVEYNEKGKPKFVKPYEIVYDLSIDSSTGDVAYRREGDSNPWAKTFVNVKDIERYYEYVSTMGTRKDLGPELMLLDITGDKKKYKHDAYCDACKYAKLVDNDYDRWLAVVKENNVAKVLDVSSDTVTGGKNNV